MRRARKESRGGEKEMRWRGKENEVKGGEQGRGGGMKWKGKEN